ncbi:hypothetical protein AB0J90_14130 [Micromonospora sp. NPDC049523]|uniref:hypothetical protein n=1 Tax=Micromonospora sp. NPDC049523 TaxID=3155921 RepID=UPI003441CE98
MSDPAHVWPGGPVPPVAGWPAPAPTVAPNRRPGVVVLAAAVLGVMAAGGLVHAILGLATSGGTVDRFRAAAGQAGVDRSEVDGFVALLRVGAGVSTAVAVGAAVLLVVLAVGNLRGANRVRITTWVVCGLGLLCGCGTLATVVVQRTVPLTSTRDDQMTTELIRALGDAYPSWWVPLTAGLSVAQALGYFVVATLLVLPAANAFFRGRTPVQVQPPVPPPPNW